MYTKRVSRDQKWHQQNPDWTGSVVSNAMLSIGALLVVTSLIYLMINLDKSDTLIFILLPIFVAGIALLFISQLIMPGRSKLIRRKKHDRNSKISKIN